MIQRQVFGTVFALEPAVAAFVFLVVLALVALAVVRRRAGRRPTASRRPERPALEAYYVGVRTAFAVFLVAWTAWQNHRGHRPPERTPVRVDVLGFQWCWTFSHPQSPVQRSVTGTCRGTDLPTLVVPTGRPVQLRLTAKDVIHALWIPDGPVLPVAAVLFWIPVLAPTRHRLDDAGRCLYLFLAAPLLDLPAVAVIAVGRPAEGIAMIVGMLPVGLPRRR
ncbi:hypothetical protein [Streptomyces mexicanus]|uniref:hypothetical protein n=1 Tax=Streptomyces mexicanus TaxID=178566 RepID=UPI0031E6D973